MLDDLKEKVDQWLDTGGTKVAERTALRTQKTIAWISEQLEIDPNMLNRPVDF